MANLSLKWQIFVDSVNFIVHNCDIKNKTNLSLSNAERHSKVTSIVKFIPSRCWSLSERVSKVVSHTGLNV